MKILAFCISLFVITIILPKSVDAQNNLSVIEEYDNDYGYTTRISGDYKLHSYDLVDGNMVIKSKPRDFYSSIRVIKDYTYDISQKTWFKFRFRMSEYLLGQDMYTDIIFYKDNDLTKPLYLTIGVNSEQHWRTNYFAGSNLPICQPYTSDNQFFISVSPDLFPDARDVRIAFPTGYTAKYTDWIEYAVLYTPPSSNTGYGTFEFYIDGRKVDSLKSLDSLDRIIIPKTQALNNLNQTKITIREGTLIDGREHAYTGNKYGTRGRGCYASTTPAIPSELKFPSKFIGNDGLMYKTDWMKKFDAIAKIMSTVVNEKYPYYQVYETPRSAINNTTYIPEAHPNEFYKGVYNFYKDEIKTKGSELIWNGINNNTIDFETAVLMGAIDLPNSNNSVWTKYPSTKRAEIETTLNHLISGYSPYLPLAKRYVWSRVYNVGGVPDIVHFGYLMPEDVVDSPAWSNLTPEEKNSIPQKPIPKESVFYWDYFKIIPADNPLYPDASSSPAPAISQGDVDHDGDVDYDDYNILVSYFGSSNQDSDFNNNDTVDIFDFNALISNF